jgi:predicted short-subunit dehydrogenase-like oxidoreductase (DUF2520 family)
LDSYLYLCRTFVDVKLIQMKIVLIGSGNVAWNLGKLFTQYKHEVVQILSRNASSSSALAYEIDTESANYFSILNKEADLYVIAVQDGAIASIVKELVGLNKLVVHTSGAMGMDVLKACTTTYGILYPLQSLLYGVREIPNISFLVQGSSIALEQQLKAFVQSLQTEVRVVTDTDKLKLHIAAVFVNNFTNHLYVLAFEWCKKNNLDFALLKPLIQESVLRLDVDNTPSASNHADINPAILQTGPAIRRDTETIKKHREALKDEPKLLEFYDLFTQSILKKYY